MLLAHDSSMFPNSLSGQIASLPGFIFCIKNVNNVVNGVAQRREKINNRKSQFDAFSFQVFFLSRVHNNCHRYFLN